MTASKTRQSYRNPQDLTFLYLECEEMERLEDEEGGLLEMRKEDVTSEALEILAAKGYVRIIAPNVVVAEEPGMFFEQVLTPQNLDSLKDACHSGKDIVLPLALAECPDVAAILNSFNYSLANEIAAVALQPAAGDENHYLPYYVQLIGEKLELELTPEYLKSAERAAKEDERIIKYKSFQLDTRQSEKKMISVSEPIRRDQTVVLQLRVDIVGKSDRLVQMQVKTLSFGVLKHDYLNGDEGALGFFPDFIRLSIEPTWDGPSVPVLYAPDGALMEVADNVLQTSGTTQEFGIEAGYGPFKGTYKLGLQETESMRAHGLQAVYEGGGDACFVWRIFKWESGQKYKFEKPGMFFSRWPKLPFKGTGPILPPIPKVEWLIPENQSVEDVSFRVSIEARMSLLWKRKSGTRFAREGQVDKLTALLQAGADPNARDKRGKTALHEACALGHEKCVEELLRAGALVSAHKTNGFTPLHYAAAAGHASVISILVARGANVNEADHKGERGLILAARVGSVPVVQVLLLHGAEINARTNNGRSSLHAAALHGHEVVVQLLLSEGADPRAADKGGTQPIHDAAGGGHIACMQILVRAGADPDASDSSGCRPLHQAASAGKLAAARWLIQTGVNVENRDNVGSTPLYWAASRGHAEMVALLIHEGRANANAANAHRSPLHIAAGWGYRGTCEELLNAGADILARDKDGLTPIEVAKRSKHGIELEGSMLNAVRSSGLIY